MTLKPGMPCFASLSPTPAVPLEENEVGRDGLGASHESRAVLLCFSP